MATETPASALATIAPLNTVAPLPALASPTVGIPATSAGNTAEWRGQWPTDGSSITVGIDVDVQWDTEKHRHQNLGPQNIPIASTSVMGNFTNILLTPCPKKSSPAKKSPSPWI